MFSENLAHALQSYIKVYPNLEFGSEQLTMDGCPIRALRAIRVIMQSNKLTGMGVLRPSKGALARQ